MEITLDNYLDFFENKIFRPKRNPREKKAFIFMYNAGISLPEIRKELGIPETTLRRWRDEFQEKNTKKSLEEIIYMGKLIAGRSEEGVVIRRLDGTIITEGLTLADCYLNCKSIPQQDKIFFKGRLLREVR